MKKKEVDTSLSEMVNAANEGRMEYFTKVKQPVVLGNTTGSTTFDDGIIYWETDYNLFCRAYNLDPNTGNYQGSTTIPQVKQLVVLPNTTVVLPAKTVVSEETKLAIKEFTKTMTQKEVAKKFGVSQQYVSKLAQNG